MIELSYLPFISLSICHLCVKRINNSHNINSFSSYRVLKFTSACSINASFTPVSSSVDLRFSQR
jgi:hypothetical protein